MYVEMKDICKKFGDYEAAKNINFGIEQGKLVALLGPSGSGKTTILRMLAGLEQQDSGDVVIEGKVVNDVAASERGIGFVFQNYALFRYMTVYDNIAFGLKVQKAEKQKIHERVMEMISLIGLEGLEKRYPNQLSGGQRQRVAFARAIAPNPQLLLLDEPFASIDAKVRKDLRKWLKEMIQKVGITSIFVTHDQEEALTMSDTIVVMNQGYIQQVGTPQDIYNEPINAFVADFIGESNIINGTMIEDRLVKILDVKFPCVDEGFGTNTPVDVVIRPEDVVLVSPEQGMLEGDVTSLIFKGVHWEIEVLANGYEWLVQTTQMHPVGSHVGIWVDPFNIQIMNKPESNDEKAVESDA